MNKLVYLAGPIDGCTYESCTNWREDAIQQLAKDGITGLSPMRAKEFLKIHQKIIDKIHNNHPLTSDSGITTRDIWDVRRCDAILFNLLGAEKVSIGTMIEYGWASAFNKPIITIIEKEGNIHEHSIVRQLSGYRIDNLESGLNIIRALFSY
jgi:nucleoside 2-deoxyribosyltransferase